jgi:aryl-alcohol dehydrogenase-like predicted oxidoreductase
MQYTTLGRTGLVVSRFAFGAMTFGPDQGGFKAGVDQAGADEMVGAALEAGINLFDTADQYATGRSEEILGRALGKRRADVVLATKVGNRMSPAPTDAGLSYGHVIAACEASLRRLGTDYVDLYQTHVYDPVTPIEETLRALDDLVRRGLVRYAGFSNLPAWQAATALGLQARHGWAPFVSAQAYYSLVGRDIEADLLPLAHAAGLGILVWSPLSGGFLSGKYTREDPTGGGGRLSSFSFPPIDRERGYDVVEVLRRIAADRAVAPAQVALAWLLAKPLVSTVLVGASRMAQLHDNLAAADLRLAADEVAALDEVSATPPVYPNWMPSGHDELTLEVLDRRRAAAG